MIEGPTSRCDRVGLWTASPVSPLVGTLNESRGLDRPRQNLVDASVQANEGDERIRTAVPVKTALCRRFGRRLAALDAEACGPMRSNGASGVIGAPQRLQVSRQGLSEMLHAEGPVPYSARHDVRADPQDTTDGDLRSGCSDVSRLHLGRTGGHRGEASMRCERAKVRGSPGARGCPDRGNAYYITTMSMGERRPTCTSAKAVLAKISGPTRLRSDPASLESAAVRVLVHRRNGRDDRCSQTRGVRALHQERLDDQERTALQLGGRRSQAGSLGVTSKQPPPVSTGGPLAGYLAWCRYWRRCEVIDAFTPRREQGSLVLDHRVELCRNCEAGGQEYHGEETQTNTQVSRQQRNCRVGSQD